MGTIFSSTNNLNNNQISILAKTKEYYDYLEPYVNSGPEYIYPIGNTIIDLLDPTIDLSVEFFFYDGNPTGPHIYIYTDGTNWINYDTSNIEDNTVITQEYSIFNYFRTDLNLTTFPITAPFKVEKIEPSIAGKLNEISPQSYISYTRDYIRGLDANLTKINSLYWSGIAPNQDHKLLFNDRWEYYNSPTNLSFTNYHPTGYGIPSFFWYNHNPLSSTKLSISNLAPNPLVDKDYTPSPSFSITSALVNDDATFDSNLNSLGYVPATFKTNFFNEYGINIDFNKHFLVFQSRGSSPIVPLVNNLSGASLNIRTNIGVSIPAINNYFSLNVFYKELDLFNVVNLYNAYNPTPFQQLFL